MEHAYANGSFDQLFSVEIHKESADKVIERFSNISSVVIFNSDSETALKEIFKKIKKEDRAFFFLDAHFPGEHSSEFNGYESVASDRVTLPLESELRLIRNSRPYSNDVIVVDDLRIYENGPFENGNLPENFGGLSEYFRHIRFVYELLPNHVITKDYRDEGYLIISPMNSEFQLTRLNPFQRMVRNIRKRIFGAI